MRFRQDGGEIAPATWLGGAVTAVTLGGVVLLAEREIGTAPAFVVFWCGCALAALCLFGAGRQHFINVGRAGAQADRAPVPTDLDRAAPAPESMKKPAKIEFVGIESDVNLSIFDDGVARWSPSHGPAHFIERGLVVAFRHAGGRDVAVNAHLTFVSSSGATVRVNYGTWLDGRIRTELFSAGDIHELVTATVNRTIPACSTFEDARENGGDRNLTVKNLPDDRYTLTVDLDVIDVFYEYSGELITKSFDFDVVLDALNPHSCSIKRV